MYETCFKFITLLLLREQTQLRSHYIAFNYRNYY